jgi:Flp pilus assembly protein TadD
VTLDFSVGELASRVEPFARRVADERVRVGDMDADDWYDLGFDLEAVSLEEARRAYTRTLELEPRHGEAHLNLGRLLHEEGRVAEAEDHYRRAVRVMPVSSLAAFNLGVALEDRGRTEEAMASYRRALQLEAGMASAHFNLARLCEASGDASGALRHLAAYRRATGRSGS